MRRPLLIVLLSLGTLGGFAHGCGSLARHCDRGPFAAHARGHHRALEDHIADVCLRAAARADDAAAAPAAKP